MSVDINPREPAAVTRVGVVPADDIVRAPESDFGGVVFGNIFEGTLLGVHAGFGAFDREREGVHDDEGIVRDFALLGN